MSYGADDPVVVGSVPRSPWEALSTSSSPLPIPGFPPSSEDEPNPVDATLQLAPEVEIGNVEYKLKLLSPTVCGFGSSKAFLQSRWLMYPSLYDL